MIRSEALRVILLGNEEVLLLGADRGDDLLMTFAEELEHALRLLVDSDHGTQKRRLLVERFTGIGAERGGDAQHLVLDECVARRIPCGVAAGLERGAQTARGEARRIGLALNEFLAGKLWIARPSGVGSRKLSCFSDVMPVRGWNQCV